MLSALTRAASLSRRVLVGDQLARELAEIARRAHHAEVGFVAFRGRIITHGDDVGAQWDADGPSPVIRLTRGNRSHDVPWPAWQPSEMADARPVHCAEQVVAGPIDLNGRVAGLLGAWQPVERDAFDGLDEDAARILSLQASSLAQSRERETRAAWRSRGLEALQQIASAICATTDVDVVFEAVAQALKGMLQYSRASVVLLEAGSPHSVRATTFDGEGRRIDPGSVPITGAVLKVAQSGELCITPDLTVAAEENRALLELGVRSTIVAPLLSSGRVIGTLNVGSGRADAFDDHHATMVQAIADQIATAVENAHAFTLSRSDLDPP